MRKSYLYMLTPFWVPLALAGAMLGFMWFVFSSAFRVARDYDWRLLP